jgi:hypothetical protein
MKSTKIFNQKFSIKLNFACLVRHFFQTIFECHFRMWFIKKSSLFKKTRTSRRKAACIVSLESLSKTTKYEDILDNFCRLHIILRILSWTSLVVAQRVFPCVAVYEY